MPSSTMVGVRPRIRTTSSYSCSARPWSRACCRMSASVRGKFAIGSAERLDQGAEQDGAVGAAGTRVNGALGMGHQTEDIAAGAQHAGNCRGRTVRIADVTQGNPVLVLEPLPGVVVAD